MRLDTGVRNRKLRTFYTRLGRHTSVLIAARLDILKELKKLSYRGPLGLDHFFSVIVIDTDTVTELFSASALALSWCEVVLRP